MANADGRSLSSGDPCISIINGLLRYRVGDDSDPFPRKAVESLVRKLKEKRDELDTLILAVTSTGGQSTKCVTIPRTLDGRLQVAARKGFPHVVYIRIWRWPDVHKNELRHLQMCQYAFDMKKDNICVNPYHYERIAAAGLDLGGLSLHQSGNESYGLDRSQLSPPYRQTGNEDVMSPLSDEVKMFPAESTSGSYTSQRQSAGVSVKQMPPVLNPQLPDAGAVAGWVSGASAWNENDHSVGHGSQAAYQGPVTLSPVNVGLATSNTWMDQSFSHPPAPTNENHHHDMLTSQLFGPVPNEPVLRLLSSRPFPEIWCSITYFEQDQKVGEIFKVSSSCQRVTVDGYTNPASQDRFCLGKLTNVQRNETTEKARLHIGKGVQLILEGESDVWVRCLSEHSIFVQSYYLDRESGRQPGDAIHKIYPAAFIKVFDLNQCYGQMRQWVLMAQSAAAQTQSRGIGGAFNDVPENLNPTVMGVDDLRQLCVLRLSFVKGWGPDYPRLTIKDTPCWIEIQLHRPLQLLDELLQNVIGTLSDPSS